MVAPLLAKVTMEVMGLRGNSQRYSLIIKMDKMKLFGLDNSKVFESLPEDDDTHDTDD